MKDTVHITGLKLATLVGIHPHEKGITQALEVDLAIETNFRAGTERDERNTLIDYQLLSEHLERSIKGQHFDLIERLAVHLARETLAFSPPADAVRVRVYKRPAGMSQVASVSAECVRYRSDFSGAV